MKRLILNQSPDSVKQDNFYVSDDEIVTETVQDCSPIIKQNKALRSNGRNTRAHGYIGASVPVTLRDKWHKEWKQKYYKDFSWITYVLMKINSRDYSELRTTDARL